MGGGSSAALVELSASLAAGDREALREALRRASASASPAEVEEAILQSHLFVGFPAALEAMALWRGLRPGDAATDAEHASEAGEPSGLTGREAEPDGVHRCRGERLCRRIYGEAYDALRENVRRLHPALDRWMVEEGYGKVLSRPGLDPARRELCNVALLAVTGHERQLHSHLRGALRLGAPPEAVQEALESGLRHAADPGWAETARGRWREVRRRHGRAASD